MSDSADFFKRQSGQMKAVVAEVREVLEATKDFIAKVQSDRPSALSLPPPVPASIPNVRKKVDTGRYAVFSPPGTVPPPPAPSAKLSAVPRPGMAPRPQAGMRPPAMPEPPAEEDSVSHVRLVGQGQAPRPFRPVPPPLPRKAASSDDDER